MAEFVEWHEPCPGCGGDAVFRVYHVPADAHAYTDRYQYEVRCKKCDKREAA